MSLLIDAKRVQAVLIDMDGTLIDHFQALYRCFKHTSESLGYDPPTPDEVRRSVGGSMPVTIRKFIPPERVEEAKRIWSERFDEIHLENVVLLKGANELLDTLKRHGVKAAIFTNKTGRHTRNICQNLGLDSKFDLILGAEDTEYRKPQKELSRIVLERLKVEARHAILIGDSPFDIEAAKCVGMTSFCVPTGSHSKEELLRAGTDRLFESLLRIAEWLSDAYAAS